MSLITIDRSLLASGQDTGDFNLASDCSDSKSSQSEDFLMCKATAVGLNVRSRRRSSFIKPNDEIQDHLKKILELLRFGDYVQLVVRLQCDVPRPHHHRYCCVVSTTGKQGTEESVVLGIDITNRQATIGLVLPIWQDMIVKLYGDGGFELITKDTVKQFKPVSVQALWAAFQAVNRACQVARRNDYYSRGLTHDWVAYYQGILASDPYQIQEWLKTDEIDEFNRYTPSNLHLTSGATEEEKERARMESLLRDKLEQLMCVVDLEEVTVLQLRERLEEELHTSLHDYRHFIEKEVLSIFGRMDEASVIFDHLFLGTTFNASNRAELERRSVTHILNVTREVDNFFPHDKYEYKNIRVYDDEHSSLLPYFEDTHRFINEAKTQGTSCLVHCKMGISRSATVVIAYAMKEYNWDLDKALAHVKSRRPCVQPNPGFMRELRTYQGILEASSNRHKPIFSQECPTLPPHAHARPDVSAAPAATTAIDSAVPPSSLTAAALNPDKQVSSSTTPIVLAGSPSRDITGVDLEHELFAYKSACGSKSPCHSSDKSLILKLRHVPSPDNSREPQPGSIQTTTFVNASPIPPTTASDATVLARNSHCLRQWHPSLAEKINEHDTVLVVRRAAKSPPTLRFADTHMLTPLGSDQVEEIDPLPVFAVVESPNASRNTCGGVSSDLATRDENNARVRLCSESSMEWHKTSVSEALLLYTGARKSSPTPISNVSVFDCSQNSEQFVQSSSFESHSVMCDSSDATSVDTTASAYTPGMATSSSMSFSTRRPLVCSCVHSATARRTSYPTSFVSHSKRDRLTAKCSCSAPSTSSISQRLCPESNDAHCAPPSSPDSANLIPSDSHMILDPTHGLCQKRPFEMVTGSNTRLVIRPARNHPTVSCLQDRSTPWIKSRLRPDDSWIVFPRCSVSAPEPDRHKADLVVVGRMPDDIPLGRSPPDAIRRGVAAIRFGAQPYAANSHYQQSLQDEMNQTRGTRAFLPGRVWVPTRQPYTVFGSSKHPPKMRDTDERTSAACDLIMAQR